MSTRATYKIDNYTFYIHHDGYPSGAADYFAAALKHRNVMPDRAPNASFADDFHRANPRSELTPGHDAHGDTEYQYTVITEGDFRFGPVKLVLIAEGHGWSFRGTVQEFIEQYSDIEVI